MTKEEVSVAVPASALSFPGVSWRPGQAEQVERILRAFDAGVETVVLESPVGSGKSLINAVVAELCRRKHGWKTWYSTPQVLLTNQIRDDPLLQMVVPIPTVYGRANYPCIEEGGEGRTVLDGFCYRGYPCLECAATGRLRAEDCETCRWGTEKLTPSCEHKCVRCEGKGKLPVEKPPVCPHHPRSEFREGEVCPYFAAVDRVMKSSIGAMTLDYWLVMSRGGEGQFGPRDLLVIDEAHGLGELGGKMAIELHERRLHHYLWKSWWEKTGSSYLERPESFFDRAGREESAALVESALRAATDVQADLSRTPLAKGETLLQRERREQAVETFRQSLEAARQELLDPEAYWVLGCDRVDHKVRLEPVTARLFLRKNVWPMSKCRILSSATFVDVDHYLRDVGLPTTNTLHLKPPSTFPANTGPIYLLPHGVELTKKLLPVNLPLAVDLVRQIVGMRSGTRGIIHPHGYKPYVDRIRSDVPDPRLVFHTPETRSEVLANWLTDDSPNSVLVGLAMTEGLDLKDDLARWQVILKCPFPNLGDRRVKARIYKLRDGQRWMDIQVMRTMLQAFGRVVRSATDFGETFVVDARATEFLREHWSDLPPDAQARIEYGDAVMSSSPAIRNLRPTERPS